MAKPSEKTAGFKQSIGCMQNSRASRGSIALFVRVSSPPPQEKCSLVLKTSRDSLHRCLFGKCTSQDGRNDARVILNIDSAVSFPNNGN